MPIFKPQPELSRFTRRYVIMLALIVLVFSIFSVRLYYLQVSHGSKYEALSQANFVDVRREVAIRGMVYDREGRLLADNRPSFNLYFTAAYCRQKSFEKTLARLTEYVGLSELEADDTREYYRSTTRLKRWVPRLVRRGMTWPELAAVEQHMNLLEGVEVRPETSRAYPGGKLAAHLLGYVGEISPSELKTRKDKGYRQGDMIGKFGIERFWESSLRGKNGHVQVVVDSRKQRVPDSVARRVLKNVEAVEGPLAGNNLVLSLDARLQALAEERFPGAEGAAVALDPRSGFILAMVSKPEFDPNVLSGRVGPRVWNELVTDPDKPLTNRATQQQYPPGSTFKPFTGLAALQSGALDVNTKQLCTGSLNFGGHIFRCWRAGGHGNIAIHSAIVHSCDVFFYRAGYKTGQDNLAQMAWSFGFGSLTGFDAGEEVPGILPDRMWYRQHTKTGFLPGFVLSNSIGQGDVNVTPLQLALAYAAIANGGTLYRPQVVLRVESPDGKLVKAFEPQPRWRVKASPENIAIMQRALEGVVNEPGGTGYYRRPRHVQFKVAGKTGTAQVVKQGQDRGKNLPYDFRDHAVFAAWAPVSDPRIAVAVVNEHGGHGSSGAAPLAMELITYYLEQIEPDSTRAEADTK